MGGLLLFEGMADQPPSHASSGLSSFLRACSNGLKPAPTPEVVATQRKYGFGGKLPTGVVMTLLAAFALNPVVPAFAASPKGSEEAMSMHALAAPSVAPAQNPDEAGPSRLWDASKDIYLIGEQHSAAGQSKILLQDMPYLKAKGMTRFALELPQASSKVMDKFVAGKITKDGLAKGLWETSYDKLPDGFKMKLDMAEWARDHQVGVVCIDADRNVLYECASAQAQALKDGGKGFIDPNGIRDVESRGIMQKHTFMTAEQAAQEGWRLWVHERSKAMAQNIAKDHKAHGGKTVALMGGIHTDVSGYRQMMQSGGADLRSTPNAGVEDLLPADLKAKTQTVLFVGGMDYTGNLDQLHTISGLHVVERNMLARGLGRQIVSIKSVEGLGAVDSVIFTPPVDKNPSVAQAAVTAPASTTIASSKTAAAAGMDLN